MGDFAKEFRIGWRDLAGSTIGLACGTGAYNSLSSFFFRALEKQFGWSKTATAFSLISLSLAALFLPLMGYLIDRFGVRKMALISALCMSASFAFLSTMNGNIVTFYFAILCLNILGSGTGPVSYARAVATSFTRSRGTALATMLVGISASTAILPFVVWQIMAHHGWRMAYQLCAVVALVGGVLAFCLVRPIKEIARAQVIDQTGDTVWQAMGKASFWALAAAIFLINAGAFGLVGQFQSVMIEKGFAATSVPLMLALLSMSVLLITVLVGVAFDNLPPERVALVALWLAAGGVVVFIFSNGSLPLAMLSVVLIGFSMGSELDMLSFFTVRCFGLRHYSAIIGVIFVFFYIGASLGGISYGFIHDHAGGYGPALVISVVELCLAGFLMLLVRGEHQPNQWKTGNEMVSAGSEKRLPY